MCCLGWAAPKQHGWPEGLPQPPAVPTPEGSSDPREGDTGDPGWGPKEPHRCGHHPGEAAHICWVGTWCQSVPTPGTEEGTAV